MRHGQNGTKFRMCAEFVGKITERTIRDRIIRLFKKKVEWDKPIGKYIGGGPAAIKAFYKVINDFDGFKADRLRMRPGE